MARDRHPLCHQVSFYLPPSWHGKTSCLASGWSRNGSATQAELEAEGMVRIAQCCPASLEVFAARASGVAGLAASAQKAMAAVLLGTLTLLQHRGVHPGCEHGAHWLVQHMVAGCMHGGAEG